MLDFTAILDRLQSHQDLTQASMVAAMQHILRGEVPQQLLVDFLVALHKKGETAAELAGAASAMRQAMVKIRSTKRPVLDTCGTGGDGSKTFNISTAAAIVLAATGCQVAKHGNRKVTSSTGSADVLSELGINLEADPNTVESCLEKIGLCFCFAPLFHPTMRHVAAARRQLAHATIFNRLGPLANPAEAEHQVIGVGDPKLQDLIALTLQQLGTTRSLVVRGDDGVDEISVSTSTRILEVTPTKISEHHWKPEMFGASSADRNQLYADDPLSSARHIRGVLDGQPGASRDVVVINAAAALWLTRDGQSLSECAEEIQHSIDDGRAKRLVDDLARLSQGGVKT